MNLLVGLGNPGSRYEDTRHNVGFWFVDRLAENKEWKESKGAQALYTWLDGTELFKPQTFMNESGKSVAYAVKKHELEPDRVTVVHDEADLPLGEFKVSRNRGGAGHKGVRSIIDALGTKRFTRLRIGVGRSDTIPLGAFVLKKMTKTEKNLLNDLYPALVDNLKERVGLALV